jgi:hypothetical protein
MARIAPPTPIPAAAPADSPDDVEVEDVLLLLEALSVSALFGDCEDSDDGEDFEISEVGVAVTPVEGFVESVLAGGFKVAVPTEPAEALELLKPPFWQIACKSPYNATHIAINQCKKHQCHRRMVHSQSALSLQPLEDSSEPSEKGLPATQSPRVIPTVGSASFVQKHSRSFASHPASLATDLRQSWTHCGKSATDMAVMVTCSVSQSPYRRRKCSRLILLATCSTKVEQGQMSFHPGVAGLTFVICCSRPRAGLWHIDTTSAGGS